MRQCDYYDAMSMKQWCDIAMLLMEQCDDDGAMMKRVRDDTIAITRWDDSDDAMVRKNDAMLYHVIVDSLSRHCPRIIASSLCRLFI